MLEMLTNKKKVAYMTRGFVKNVKDNRNKNEGAKLRTWVIIRSMFENDKMVQC